MEYGDKKISDVLKYAAVSYAYARMKFEDEQRFIEEASGGDDKKKALWKSMFERGFFSLTQGGHFMNRVEAADENLVGKYITRIIKNKPYIDILRDMLDEDIKAMCAMTEANIEELRSLLDGTIPIGPAKFIVDRSDCGMEPFVIKPYLGRVQSLFYDIYQLKVSKHTAALMDAEPNHSWRLHTSQTMSKKAKRQRITVSPRGCTTSTGRLDFFTKGFRRSSQTSTCRTKL